MQLFGVENIQLEDYDLYETYKLENIEIESALESIDYINNQLGLEDFKDNIKKVKEFIIKLWNNFKNFISNIYNKIKGFFNKSEKANKSTEERVNKMKEDLNDKGSNEKKEDDIKNQKIKENEIFMEKIKENNVFKIKSYLENLIARSNGDKILCDEAIEYALKNSSFKWEIDDGKKLQTQFTTAREKYNYEKEKLVRNFTKERYENVLKLYKEYIIERDDKNVQITVVLYKDLDIILEKTLKEFTKLLQEDKMSLELKKLFDQLDFNSLSELKKLSTKLIQYNKDINNYLKYIEDSLNKVSKDRKVEVKVTDSKNNLNQKIKSDITIIEKSIVDYKNNFNNSRKKAKEILDFNIFKKGIEEKMLLLNNDTSNEIVLELQTLIKELRILTSQIAMYYVKKDKILINTLNEVISHYEKEIIKLK